MNSKISKALQDQKESIVNELTNYVKSTHPTRTSLHYKCSRDLTFVYEAYIDCLNHNSDRPLQFIIRNFYKRGTCQLNSTDVELDVHSILKNKILEILNKNLAPTELIEFFSYLSNEFSHQLEHGPRNVIMNYDIQKWIERYTVREFDQENLPDVLDVKELVNLIGYIPSQESKFDHFWILHKPEDYQMKKWLMENIYYNHSKTKKQFDKENEYMWPVFNAPYVFQCVRVWGLNTNELDVRRNEGFHAGVLVSSILNMGYGVAQIGCTDGYHKDEKKVQKEFRKKIFEKFEEKLKNFGLHGEDGEVVLLPAICVAFGIPLPMQQKDFMYTKKGIKYYVGQKPKKRFPNVVADI